MNRAGKGRGPGIFAIIFWQVYVEPGNIELAQIFRHLKCEAKAARHLIAGIARNVECQIVLRHALPNKVLGHGRNGHQRRPGISSSRCSQSPAQDRRRDRRNFTFAFVPVVTFSLPDQSHKKFLLIQVDVVEDRDLNQRWEPKRIREGISGPHLHQARD